jgi:hypothetical protein
MPPDGPRLAQQQNPQRDQPQECAQENPADVEPARARRDDGSQHEQPDGEREVVAPLTGRDPRSGKDRDRSDHAEIGRVVDVLASNAQQEF